MRRWMRGCSFLSKKALYATTLVALFAAAGIYMMVPTAATVVGAQKSRADITTSDLAPRPDRLAIALDFRSAHNVTVFGGGAATENMTVRGGDATASKDKVRADLARAMSIIPQLDCTQIDGDMTGRTVASGVYCLPEMRLAGQLTLDGIGDTRSNFVFIVKGDMNVERGAVITHQNGALPGNVYFVMDGKAAVADGVAFGATILARGNVTIGAGSDVKGRVWSVGGKVTSMGESTAGAGTGILEICKYERDRSIRRPLGAGEGVPPEPPSSLSNRIFRFQVGGNVYYAPVGSCTGQIELPVGNVIITELNSGPLIGGAGTDTDWVNRFELVDVTASPANALGAVNFPARTAVIFVREGDITNQTLVEFTNEFAIVGTIEICKRVAAIGVAPVASAPDPDVSGFFDYTIDAIPNQIFTVPVGQCSSPISILQVADGMPDPAPGQGNTIVYVTEKAHPEYQLESVSTFPASRLDSFAANLGILNSKQCSNIGPYPIPNGPPPPGEPDCQLSNDGGGVARVEIWEGGVSSQTTINFFNRSRPGRVKVCKVAGPGIPVGTMFRFRVQGTRPNNPFPGPQLPGVDSDVIIDVPAGPAPNGFCDFVDGRFIIGTNVLVREIQVLTPTNGTRAGEDTPNTSRVEAGSTKTVVETVRTPGRSQTPPANAEPIPYQEFPINGVPYKGAAPPVAQLGTTGANLPKRDLASRLISDSIFITAANATRGMARSALSGEAVMGGGNPQPAILGATSASNRAVVYPDANDLPTPVQNLVTGLPSGAQPHGVAYFGTDNALISDFLNSRIHVVQISTAALLSTINTAPAGYDGTGTVAVAPNLSAALAIGSNNSLKVIQGPFGPASTITSLTLPGLVAGYQTQAIVFNNAGRAFVYHTTGISVLDAPYNAIAFTIPTGNTSSGAIGISPNGNTLLTTTLSGNSVQIFQAPFSAASTSTALTIPGGNALDGIMVAPDGTRAIVVSASAYHAAAIFAPFSNSSTVESIPLPATGNGGSFEDVGISADSQVAILAGNSTTNPPVFIRAPFGSTSPTFNVPVAGVANPARGNGAVRFLPPGLAPGLTISKTAPATIPSGSNLTYTINYANTGSLAANDVVITDPVPAGTTFVSATGGGTLQSGNVVWNIGTLNPGDSGSVMFTVTVNTAEGGTVDNNNYTIQADGVAPIPGPPVSTNVLAPLFPPNVCVSRIRLNGALTGFPPGPVTVQGVTVNPNPNRDTRAAVFTARRGTMEIEFANFICEPTVLKVCKTAGPGVAPGTAFTFSVRIDDEGGLFAPPSSIAVPDVTVLAGSCKFAQGPYTPTATVPPVGTFRVGSKVYVTEAAAAGTTITSVTSPTGNAIIACPDSPTPARCRGMGLLYPGGVNEINFTNAVGPEPTEAPFDFDGDGKTDVSVTRMGGSSKWYQLVGANHNYVEFDLGQTGDIVVPADYDGDGTTQPGVFRPSTGDWWVMSDDEAVTIPMNAGAVGDIPLPSDYTGDGKADFVLFRPSTSQWLRYANGSTATSHMSFGSTGDKPLMGDFDGDDKADPAIFRPSTGTFWYASSAQWDTFRAVQWGMAGDIPIAADFDGDDKTDMAVFRPSTGEWWIRRSSDEGLTGAQWGGNGDRPLTGDWDGDGKADLAVFRPSNGTWYIVKSGGGFQGYQWGMSSDIPSPGVYVP